MNQAVKITGFLISVHEIFVFQIHVVRTIGRENHLQCFTKKLWESWSASLILSKFGLQPIEIESVTNIVVVHFAKETMVLERAEPLDPPTISVLGV